MNIILTIIYKCIVFAGRRLPPSTNAEQYELFFHNTRLGGHVTIQSSTRNWISEFHWTELRVRVDRRRAVNSGQARKVHFLGSNLLHFSDNAWRCSYDYPNRKTIVWHKQLEDNKSTFLDTFNSTKSTSCIINFINNRNHVHKHEWPKSSIFYSFFCWNILIKNFKNQSVISIKSYNLIMKF